MVLAWLQANVLCSTCSSECCSVEIIVPRACILKCDAARLRHDIKISYDTDLRSVGSNFQPLKPIAEILTYLISEENIFVQWMKTQFYQFRINIMQSLSLNVLQIIPMNRFRR